MSVLADRDSRLDGNYVNFYKNASQSANLNPGQSLTVETPVLGSTLLMFVESLDLANPYRVREVGGAGGGPGGGENELIEEWQYVPVTARLFRPDSENAVLTWTTPHGWYQEDHVVLQLSRTYDTGPFPNDASTPARAWTLRVTNTSNRRVRCQSGVGGVYSHLPIRSWHLTHRLLNHAFRVLLEALTLGGYIQGRTLVLGLGRELAELEGMPQTIRIDITDELPSYLPQEETYVSARSKIVSTVRRLV